MAIQVAGELYYDLDGQLAEIKRQLRQPSGYPFDPMKLKSFLQLAVEGKFNGVSAIKLPILTPRTPTVVGPLTKNFDSSKFFKTRKGLYVDSSFSSRIPAQISEPSDMVSLQVADLTRNVYDREIKAELAEHCEVELWHIATLIEAQPNGGGGSLLNNGYANIFYVGGFIVDVFWHAVRGLWYVRDWELVDAAWLAGSRVFSRN